MEPFKNEFSFENACRIAGQIHHVHPEFSARIFRLGLEDALEPLELKQRMQLIAMRIAQNLPSDPAVMFPILVAALAKNPQDKTGLRGFAVWPLTEIVSSRGLDSFPESMTALREMTRCFTAEFAIRPFLRIHQKKTLKQLQKWIKDPDPHVRRLVSEGTRPLLSWGERLPALMAEPALAMPLLEKLYQDESDYVRLSVSNHLNDFSKSHPELVVETLRKWGVSARDQKHFAKLARHSCRTLIKQGHPEALEFHGFGSGNSLEVLHLRISPRVQLGGYLEYSLSVRNTTEAPIRALFDYAILHLKANGSHSPKVFKGRVKDLAPGEVWEITGRHALRLITTRVYHPGLQRFEPRINGRISEYSEFVLET